MRALYGGRLGAEVVEQDVVKRIGVPGVESPTTDITSPGASASPPPPHGVAQTPGLFFGTWPGPVLRERSSRKLP